MFEEPRLDDPGSVFAERNHDYCFEKIQEYGRHPNDEVVVHVAEFAIESIIGSLGELEAKMRQHGKNPEHSQFPEAIRAALELQQYVHKQNSSITSEMEARIYVRSLEQDLIELRRLERDLDSEAPDHVA